MRLKTKSVLGSANTGRMERSYRKTERRRDVPWASRPKHEERALIPSSRKPVGSGAREPQRAAPARIEAVELRGIEQPDLLGAAHLAEEAVRQVVVQRRHAAGRARRARPDCGTGGCGRACGR